MLSARLIRKRFAVIVISVCGLGCRVDQLITPTGASDLVVDPATLADSAPLGSTAMRHRNITIDGEPLPGRTWRATVSGGSTWLQLERAEDTVPSSVGVLLKPAGLTLGSYQDTIVVTSDVGDSAVRVPVRFLVQLPPRLAISVQPSPGVAGHPIAPAVVVVAQDGAGRTLSAFSDAVTITLGKNTSGASLAGTTTVNASGGVATFSNLTLNRKGTGYTLVASGSGVTSIETAPFNMAAPPISASRSTLTVSYASIGASLGTSVSTITVTAIDELGDAVSGAPVVILASGNANVITPPNGTSNANGIMTATFSSTASGTRAITATAGGVTLSNTASITVTAGPVVQLGFTVQPSDVVLGGVISPSIQVSGLDAFGNFASFYGYVSLGISAGPKDAILTGTATVYAPAGVATFPNIGLSTPGTGYALIAGSNGISPVVSKPFNVTK
jgi:hypothetical protein